jgi:D-arabinose 1-dehydrogenase-like Zn-dependent alcohol dehydrogenase
LLTDSEIPFKHGAILMCSSSTAFQALRKSRLKGGETVATFGVGGLGISAVQLAQVFGALDVYAVDINADKYLIIAFPGSHYRCILLKDEIPTRKTQRNNQCD